MDIFFTGIEVSKQNNGMHQTFFPLMEYKPFKLKTKPSKTRDGLRNNGP